MLPEELQGLLTSMDVAAAVVEAIDEPALQAQRGWDLARWSYDCIPWGVRFLRRDSGHRVTAIVKAVVLAESDATAASFTLERPLSPQGKTHAALSQCSRRATSCAHLEYGSRPRLVGE